MLQTLLLFPVVLQRLLIQFRIYHMGLQMFLLHLLQKYCKKYVQTVPKNSNTFFLFQLQIIFNVSIVLTKPVLTFTQNLNVFTVLEQLQLSNTLKFFVTSTLKKS